MIVDTARSEAAAPLVPGSRADQFSFTIQKLADRANRKTGEMPARPRHCEGGEG